MKQFIIEMTIAFSIGWIAMFVLSGCVLQQSDAYKVISVRGSSK